MSRRAKKGFAAKLRTTRKEAGISQYALAKQIGVSKQFLSLLEFGRREPSWETVQKLADALGVQCSVFTDEGRAPRTTETTTKRKGKMSERTRENFAKARSQFAAYLENLRAKAAKLHPGNQERGFLIAFAGVFEQLKPRLEFMPADVAFFQGVIDRAARVLAEKDAGRITEDELNQSVAQIGTEMAAYRHKPRSKRR
jgi:transcriptional regulator with XRE-family HTH domain